MESDRKRKVEGHSRNYLSKKSKGPKNWQVLRKHSTASQLGTLQPGIAGIWVTCDMHKEKQCASEALDLLMETASSMYPEAFTGCETETNDGLGNGDIEADIRNEIENIKTPNRTNLLFQTIKLNVCCVTFFKTREPIEPTALVHQICMDAMDSATMKKSRWIRRLTPSTLIGKASVKGLDEVSKLVLSPHFHQKDGLRRKFAIRTSIRNHTTLTKDAIIKQVAEAVGPSHSVDLTHYDLLILVDVYKNVCGMSVVGNNYEKFKRYNLSEIYDPTVKSTPAVISQ